MNARIKADLQEFVRARRCESVHHQMVKKCGAVFDILMVAVVADDPPRYGRLSLAVVTNTTGLLETKRQLRVSEVRHQWPR